MELNKTEFDMEDKMQATKDKALEILNILPEEKAKVALSFMEFLQEKDEWEATYEILQDRELVKTYKKGLKDIEEGNIEDWEAVKRRLFTSKGRSLRNV